MAKTTKTVAEVKSALHDETEIFEWETPAGVVRLPFLENVPMGIIEDAAGKTAAEFMEMIVTELMDEESAKARRSLTLQGFNRMLAAWDEQSGIKVGELFA